MTPLLALYRAATTLAAPFVPMVLRRRVAAGKEDADRLNERLARTLPPRPAGTLLWCHGASVGESLLLLGFVERFRETYPDLLVLFTSQTLTSATLMAERIAPGDRHQFAPTDTPGATARFLDHWAPDAAVFAEGEIWPNLLLGARARGVPMALLNARSTQKTLDGWARYRGAARALFAAFSAIIPADQRTAEGLSALLGKPLSSPGNLKAALPPPLPTAALPPALQTGRPILLAASTHDGEERLVLDAWQTLPSPRPHLIIAPRHPERGPAIRDTLQGQGFEVAQRSLDEAPVDGAVYLADTLGEMGLWYHAADLVYLGGGHAEGVGGHNPMEPLRLGKPVISGPHVFNFQTVQPLLERTGGLTIAEDSRALAALIAGHVSGAAPLRIDGAALSEYFSAADAPMAQSIAAVTDLLSVANTG